jgi:hypothetical protein
MRGQETYHSEILMSTAGFFEVESAGPEREVQDRGIAASPQTFL